MEIKPYIGTFLGCLDPRLDKRKWRLAHFANARTLPSTTYFYALQIFTPASYKEIALPTEETGRIA